MLFSVPQCHAQREREAASIYRYKACTGLQSQYFSNNFSNNFFQQGTLNKPGFTIREKKRGHTELFISNTDLSEALHKTPAKYSQCLPFLSIVVFFFLKKKTGLLLKSIRDSVVRESCVIGIEEANFYNRQCRGMAACMVCRHVRHVNCKCVYIGYIYHV